MTRPFAALLVLSAAGLGLTAHFLTAQTSSPDLKPSFEQVIKPFFDQNCMKCHNSDASIAGVRVDQLTPLIEDRHIATWEAVRHRVESGTMPPKGLPQPSAADRERFVAWIKQAVEMARLRPAPKNGLIRRLTVAQYRNTLRELLDIEDDLTSALPPDAVSRDGFVNNRDTLQLSPLLTEAYLEIAEKALNVAIVDTKHKPVIETFRMDLGRNVNPAPLKEKLILGAGSQLLDNADFVVTEPIPSKPFAFEPFKMQTKFRFIEGYRGNDTVRGWREFDSIYHAVFADMRGSAGYPKGKPYGTVPEGLLLRPAIPTEEMFDEDGTYGPKANFKISLRELPDNGRFRVTVTAAKYRDGLLLDPGTQVQQAGADAVVLEDLKAPREVNIAKSGVYQVDLITAKAEDNSPDASKLKEGLTGVWPKDKSSDSPVGKAMTLDGSPLVVPRAELPTNDAQHVGEGDFSVSAWVHAKELKRSTLISLMGTRRGQGWSIEMQDNGSLRFQTSGLDDEANGRLFSSRAVKSGAWQHLAIVMRRGKNDTRLYVNGTLVARAAMGAAQFDDPSSDLRIGEGFVGEMADVRLYRRPLAESEIAALVLPGKQLVKKMTERQSDVVLKLGNREFSGALKQPAFLAVRLDAGPLNVWLKNEGVRDVEKIVLTPISSGPQFKQFVAFEKRSPRVGVHLGLRRDCGSTFGPVGGPQPVPSEKLSKFVFEGAIQNFPSPDVEKDNVNYLAGVREIAVRSEFTDGRDMPRLVIRSVEFEGPLYEQWPPKSHKNIFVDFERKNDQTAYAQRIISNFATRAYRRPASEAETDALMSVYSKSAAAGNSFEQSIKNALAVALTSPQFLFLVETSKTPAPEPLDAYELASKLSYFLWNGPPDKKTLQLASSGLLAKQLDPEVSRMVTDPRFSRFADEFTSQWLSLEKFAVLEADRKRYPKMTRAARTQLAREPIEFVEYLIRNNLPVKNLISSDFLMANEAVANYYDMPEKTENGFKFMAIPHGRPELGGVLTQAALMAGLSDGRESNPVKRGAWVARKIVAEPPADPPPNVPALKEETKNLTLRQRLEQHRNQSACRQCHSKIDPWGVALEEFDAGGRMKKQPTDAHAVLPDKTEVSGINDLKKYLAEDRIDQVAYSVLKHLTTYATGRTLTYNEQTYLKQDAIRLKANGYKMQDMVRYVVNSKMFLEK